MFLRCISLPSLTSLLKVTIHVLTTAVYVRPHWQEVDIDDHLCGASVVSWEVASVEFVSWCSTHSHSYRCCFVKFCIKYLYHKGSSLGLTFYWWRHVSKIYPGRQKTAETATSSSSGVVTTDQLLELYVWIIIWKKMCINYLVIKGQNNLKWAEVSINLFF